MEELFAAADANAAILQFERCATALNEFCAFTETALEQLKLQNKKTSSSAHNPCILAEMVDLEKEGKISHTELLANVLFLVAG